MANIWLQMTIWRAIISKETFWQAIIWQKYLWQAVLFARSKSNVIQKQWNYSEIQSFQNQVSNPPKCT